MEFEPGKIITGFLILMFLLVFYQRFTSPEFLQMIGFQANDQRYFMFLLDIIRPIILTGIFAVVVNYMFGSSIPTTLITAVVGIVAYFVLTSPLFLSTIGMSYAEQNNFFTWKNFLDPLIILGIMIGIAAAVMHIRGE